MPGLRCRPARQSRRCAGTHAPRCRGLRRARGGGRPGPGSGWRIGAGPGTHARHVGPSPTRPRCRKPLPPLKTTDPPASARTRGYRRP
ncbi:hypothetical protein G6F22_018616 [Rhizopus arrhizus]|nr:hypothetical protein G6F22_018616 [Rhizopus arrhizus]